MSVQVYVFMCLMAAGVNAADDWGYSGEHGPPHWPGTCTAPDSKKQSPINIKAADAEYEEALTAFSFSGYDEANAVVKNNGHSVQATMTPSQSNLTGGDLGTTFRLAQFHFHWGSEDNKGSEHSLNDKFYPMEVHFVHFNSKYADVGTAADKPDGLAVLGFFFEVVTEDNEEYADVVNATNVVKTSEEASAELDNFDVKKLMGDVSGTYFRYSGSLTTPGCHESVTWTVFEKPIGISAAQMNVFRAVTNGESDGHKTYNNFRPVQELHERKVYTSKEGDIGAATSLTCSGLLVAGLAILLVL